MPSRSRFPIPATACRANSKRSYSCRTSPPRNAVRATNLGGYYFLEKPVRIERTRIVVKNAIESKKLQRESGDLEKQLQSRSLSVGDSIPMKALCQQIGLMAPTNGRVLIYGESG